MVQYIRDKLYDHGDIFISLLKYIFLKIISWNLRQVDKIFLKNSQDHCNEKTAANNIFFFCSNDVYWLIF